jgi:putative membrane protein
MIQLIVNVILSALAVAIAAKVLPGVKVKGFGTALVVAVMLSMIMPSIAPALTFLQLPIDALTVGLVTFICNGFFILLVGTIIPGFSVESFGWACLFSFALSGIQMIFYTFL